MDGWMNGWWLGWMDVWMDEWMEGWMEGWMDVVHRDRTYNCNLIHTMAQWDRTCDCNPIHTLSTGMQHVIVFLFTYGTPGWSMRL